MKRSKVNWRCPKPLMDDLRKIKAETGVSVNSLVLLAIGKAIDKHQRQIERADRL